MEISPRAELDQHTFYPAQEALFERYLPAKGTFLSIIKVPQTTVHLGDRDVANLVNQSIAEGIRVFKINDVKNPNDPPGELNLKIKRGTIIHLQGHANPIYSVDRVYKEKGKDLKLRMLSFFIRDIVMIEK